MQVRSIIWIPLAVLLAGCGESALQRATRVNAQLMSEARKLIAEGLDEIEWEAVGDNVACNSLCLPNVLEKWEKAAVVLRPLRPANASATINIHSDLDYVIAAGRACEAATGAAEKNKTFELFVFRIAGLTSCNDFQNPFSDKTGRLRPTTRASLSRKADAPSAKSEITGLFGLKLSEELPVRLVRKLDDWREWAEVGVYSVTPPQPSEVFDSYMVHLQGGPIYKIQASRNGRGHTLVNIYDDAKKELISQFGPPTSTGAVDDRGDSGIAWEQNLRYGGRVRMTLALRKDSNAGYVVPGIVMLELQKLR